MVLSQTQRLVLSLPHSYQYISIVPGVVQNEFYGIMYMSIAICIWKVISENMGPVSICIQRGLYNKLGPKVSIKLQWHWIYQACMIYEVFYGVLKIIVFDLNPDSLILASPTAIDLPNPALYLVSFAPYVALVTQLILLCSCVKWHRLQARCDLSLLEEEAFTEQWDKFKEYSQVTGLLLLPCVFGFMSLDAWIRIWQVFQAELKAGAQADSYISLFRGDLCLASFIQYLVVWSFCSYAMGKYNLSAECRDQQKIALPSEKLPIFKYPVAFLLILTSVFACVICGMLQNTCIVLELLSMQDKIPMKLAPIHHSIDLLATVFTILAALQMTCVNKIKALQDLMPSPNLKFNAARSLVMIAQIQGKLLVPLSYKPEDYINLSSVPFFAKLGLNGYHTSLCHVCLIQYELILVVALQFYLWNKQANREAQDFFKSPLSRRFLV